MPEPQRSCRAAFRWKKVKSAVLATSHSHRGVSSPPCQVPSNPGPRSQKAADCSVDLIKRRPTGRRKLSARATDANRSDVPPTSVSALIAPPNIELTDLCPSRQPSNKKPVRWDSMRLGLPTYPVKKHSELLAARKTVSLSLSRPLYLGASSTVSRNGSGEAITAP